MPSSDAALPMRTVKGRSVLDAQALLAGPTVERSRVFSWLRARCAAHEPSAIAGLESWGYLFAAPVAIALEIGLLAVRRQVEQLGPDAVIDEYDMNHSQGRSVGMQPVASIDGARIVLIDDTVVSGGTLAAAASVLERLGGHVVATLCVVGDVTAASNPVLTEQLNMECFEWLTVSS
jgi:adenine phosphoribosyltransferase